MLHNRLALLLVLLLVLLLHMSSLDVHMYGNVVAVANADGNAKDVKCKRIKSDKESVDGAPKTCTSTASLSVRPFSKIKTSVYQCTTEQLSTNDIIEVNDASAQLTKGCVLKDKVIIFDLSEMYKNNPSDPVVINISQAAFINSHIKLINAHSIPGNIVDAGPLLLTMIESEMNGSSKIEFGSYNYDISGAFKLPPFSRIRILHSKMNISAKDEITLFNFYNLELETDSSMEIAHNVITMEYKDGGHTMTVFYVRVVSVSDNSNFTLRGNEISMNACNVFHTADLKQYVWYQGISFLRINKNSNFAWISNNISMVTNGGKYIYQYVWCTFFSNMTISITSQLLLYSNNILMLAKNYERRLLRSSLMKIGFNRGNISGGSSVVLRDNCVGMGQIKTDKRYMFIGKWSITDNSELLLDGNYFTTTEYLKNSHSSLTQFLWGLNDESPMIIEKSSNLTIVNIQVNGNIYATNGARSSVYWNSSLIVSNIDVQQPYTYDNRDDNEPTMVWSSYPSKDSEGIPIPTLDYSNIQQYMCIGVPNASPITPTTITPTIPIVPTVPAIPIVFTAKPTPKPKCKSATAILSIIPSVLITSVVLLYLTYLSDIKIYVW